MNSPQRPADYATNEAGLITTPGKYAGQPLYVPAFWEASAQGIHDDEYTDRAGRHFIVFRITADDLLQWPELRDDNGWAYQLIVLCEDAQGFVTCELKGQNPDL